MDYCKSVKLLLCLTVQVLMWKTVTVSPMDAEIGEIRIWLMRVRTFGQKVGGGTVVGTNSPENCIYIYLCSTRKALRHGSQLYLQLH